MDVETTEREAITSEFTGLLTAMVEGYYRVKTEATALVGEWRGQLGKKKKKRNRVDRARAEVAEEHEEQGVKAFKEMYNKAVASWKEDGKPDAMIKLFDLAQKKREAIGDPLHQTFEWMSDEYFDEWEVKLRYYGFLSKEGAS